MQQPIIIRYGELALKSNYVRRQFIRRLVHNIEAAFLVEKKSCMIDAEWGRLFLFSDDLDSAKLILKRIMGITSFSPATQSSSDPEDIVKTSVEIAQAVLDENTSFAVRAQRTGNHDYSSQDMAKRLGSALVEKFGSSVDLSSPDVEIGLEIRNNSAYHFFERVIGVGGLPLGTQGTVLCEIYCPSDLLAAWFLARRGCMPILQLKNSDCLAKAISFANHWFLNQDLIVDSDDSLGSLSSKCTPQALVVGLRLSKKDALRIIQSKKQQSSLPLLTPLVGLSDDEIHCRLETIGV